MFRVSHLAVGLCELSVPAHLPLHKAERHLFTAPPPPSLDVFLLYSTLYQLASHLPRAARQTCCFCSTNNVARASQSKLTSKGVNSRVRNQLTNSDTLMAAHVHTHRGQTSMGEWFYKHKWVLKYRVSASCDQNYICHSVITEHTHHG